MVYVPVMVGILNVILFLVWLLSDDHANVAVVLIFILPVVIIWFGQMLLSEVENDSNVLVFLFVAVIVVFSVRAILRSKMIFLLINRGKRLSFSDDGKWWYCRKLKGYRNGWESERKIYRYCYEYRQYVKKIPKEWGTWKTT